MLRNLCMDFVKPPTDFFQKIRNSGFFRVFLRCFLQSSSMGFLKEILRVSSKVFCNIFLGFLQKTWRLLSMNFRLLQRLLQEFLHNFLQGLFLKIICVFFQKLLPVFQGSSRSSPHFLEIPLGIFSNIPLWISSCWKQSLKHFFWNFSGNPSCNFFRKFSNVSFGFFSKASSKYSTVSFRNLYR